METPPDVTMMSALSTAFLNIWSKASGLEDRQQRDTHTHTHTHTHTQHLFHANTVGVAFCLLLLLCVLL